MWLPVCGSFLLLSLLFFMKSMVTICVKASNHLLMLDILSLEICLICRMSSLFVHQASRGEDCRGLIIRVKQLKDHMQILFEHTTKDGTIKD